MKKSILCTLLTTGLILSGCLSTSQETVIPSDWGGLVATIQDDTLLIEYRMYEGHYGELDLRMVSFTGNPTDTNTLLFEHFKSGFPSRNPRRKDIPLETSYVHLIQRDNKTAILGTNGKEVQADRDVIVLLEHPRHSGLFSYVLLRKGELPIVLFVKPQVFPRRTKLAIPAPSWR